MDKPTAESLLLARMHRGSKISTISPRDDFGPAPLSFAQQRLWFLDQLNPGRADYAMPFAFRVHGPLDVPVLRDSFRDVVERHEVLRTRFETGDQGVPVQIAYISPEFEFSVFDLVISEESEPQAESALKLIQEEASRPFDLSSGKLLRVKLVRLAADVHLLLVSLHHIVADGWSIDILTRDLRAFYAARIRAAETDLPKLGIQYADFAAWQHQWLSGPALERQLSYWREQLAGLEPAEPPTDRPRPAVPSGAGASVYFTVPDAVVSGLRELTTEEGASLFMTMLAAFQAVLLRWTGQDDISVGTPIAGRNRAEVEDLIGFFVNTLVIRSDLSGDPTFRDLLRQVKGTTLDAYSHQDLAFDLLVEDLAPQRDLSRMPLVNCTFAISGSGEDWALPGLTVEPFQLPTETSKFDFSLFLSEDSSGGFRGDLVFSTELFDRTTIERLADRYVRILQAVAADPGQSLSQVEVLDPGERELLLHAWNDTFVAH
ncbi:condensation domain-containing protein, partial [Streptomyces griseochromogenes]|uniref:condensation domain-containing protein n=1 Tax=Streptomyces griseochromogenes TaxID=68214 RepID=UPI0037A4A92F